MVAILFLLQTQFSSAIHKTLTCKSTKRTIRGEKNRICEIFSF